MKKNKNVGAVLFMGVMLMFGKTNVNAVTPQYRPPQTDFTIEGIADAVKDYLKENPIKITFVEMPKITENTYRHSRAFYDKSRLIIRWNAVEDADYYEIKVTKRNGETKTYNSTYNSLIVYQNSDDFINDCVRGGTVKVKAKKGYFYSDWSEEKTITCNSFHR